MARPLEGYSVLVTRPVEQAAGLIAEIERNGGQVLFAPMIGIQPKRNDQAAVRAIDSLADYQAVIFISRNAVEFGMALIRRRERSLAHAAVYAVGVGSAAQLRGLGVSDVLTPRSEFSSEGLLKLPGLSSQAIEGKNVLIIRGAGGRELLAQTLVARGARVDYCEVYERVVPPTCLAEVLKAVAPGLPDIGIITSPEALTNLANKIDEEGVDLLYEVPLLVVGSRTAQAVEGLGFTEPPIVVDNPGDQCIVAAIIRWVADEQ